MSKPQKVHCSICNKPVVDFYPTFFYDKEGRLKYGAICISCNKK